MKYSKAKIQQLNEQGVKDARAGKSIMAFYDIPAERHPEWARASYEKGWRWAREEMRKEERKKK